VWGDRAFRLERVTGRGREKNDRPGEIRTVASVEKRAAVASVLTETTVEHREISE